MIVWEEDLYRQTENIKEYGKYKADNEVTHTHTHTHIYFPNYLQIG